MARKDERHRKAPSRKRFLEALFIFAPPPSKYNISLT
jgi:hypothetical protein